MKNYAILLLLFPFIFLYSFANAQQITGFWKGKIGRKNVELKIIKNGDSLTGTSYYYESPNSYSRYSIKGYFDGRDNSAVWWDDQLIEEKKTKRLLITPTPNAYFSTADFNCPGSNRMYLNGNAALKEKKEQPDASVDLQKSNTHNFKDEWDFIIDNYTDGANDPEMIDSVGRLAFNKPLPLETMVAQQTVPAPSAKKIFAAPGKNITVVKPVREAAGRPAISATPLNNIQKFTTRRKQILQEIPVSSDSIELRFYDNAEVDGDSIAVFLNDHLIDEHLRLTEKAHTIRLAVADLKESNELVMVAENLGSIPPNTSLMVAIVDGKRYEARLESTEQSSAGIRFIRRMPPVQ